MVAFAGFLRLVLAIALGFGIPLFLFQQWLSSRLDWYLGRVVGGDLAKIVRASETTASNASSAASTLHLIWERED